MKFKKEIEKLLKNLNKIHINEWQKTRDGKNVLWFMDRQKPSVVPDYSFDEERFGVTYEGQIIWGFDSGCSCPSPWNERPDSEQYEIKTWKEFLSSPEQAFDAGWDDECYDTLKKLLEKYVPSKRKAGSVH